jgi:hexosaminidase
MYRRLDLISFQMEELGLTHIKNYEMMLRRLTRNQDITALRLLVDVVEPVKIYQRHSQGVKYTSYSPYTRVVDTARPESMTARAFSKAVDTFLKDGPAQVSAETVLLWLSQWRDNHTALKKIMEGAPVLQEMESLSQDLSHLSVAGLKAVDALLSEKKMDAEWRKQQQVIIDRARKPRGQTELMVVTAIQKLIDAASVAQ